MSTSIKALPLWFRYLVAVLVGAAIVVALVLWVTHHQQPLVESAAPANRHQELVEVSEDRQLTVQQQAPHRAALGTATSPRAAASQAVAAYVPQLGGGQLDSVSCRPAATSATAGGAGAGRVAFSCDAVAGDRSQDKSLRYPFDVVVNSSARQVTFCEVVTPPYPVKPVPVSAACR